MSKKRKVEPPSIAERAFDTKALAISIFRFLSHKDQNKAASTSKAFNNTSEYATFWQSFTVDIRDGFSSTYCSGIFNKLARCQTRELRIIDWQSTYRLSDTTNTEKIFRIPSDVQCFPMIESITYSGPISEDLKCDFQNLLLKCPKLITLTFDPICARYESTVQRFGELETDKRITFPDGSRAEKGKLDDRICRRMTCSLCGASGQPLCVLNDRTNPLDPLNRAAWTCIQCNKISCIPCRWYVNCEQDNCNATICDDCVIECRFCSFDFCKTHLHGFNFADVACETCFDQKVMNR
jgi:hypothetical protein